MKKNVALICLFLLLSFYEMSGQSRLGMRKNEIINEFTQTGYEIQYKTTSFGVPYIKIISQLASVIYYFDENDICKMCILFPSNPASLSYFKDQYNKKYMIASSTKWVSKSNGINAIIELVYTKKGGYFFVWHE